MPVSSGNESRRASLIRLACDDPTLPTDERNLVVRIVQAWGEAIGKERLMTGSALPPIDATLLKRIPAGAGLGGGSSDAACALLAADLLWTGGIRPDGTPRPAEDLSAFAAGFGSDVPFFLHGPSAICTGRGEIVRPTAEPTAARWALLVLPAMHVSTPEVYRRFDAMGLGRGADVEQEPEFERWAALPAVELMEQLVNDLEPAAFAVRPELAELRTNVERLIGRTVRMSGSGSSLFTLFDDRPQADEAGGRVGRETGLRCEVIELSPWERRAPARLFA